MITTAAAALTLPKGGAEDESCCRGTRKKGVLLLCGAGRLYKGRGSTW